MNTAHSVVSFALSTFLWTTSVHADDGVERQWLSKTNGTFKGSSGSLTLAYQGEGNVEVTLQTDRCNVTPATSAAGTVGEQVVLLSSATGATSLVIFVEVDYVVLVALEDFSTSFCEGGQDVDGRYLLVQPS